MILAEIDSRIAEMIEINNLTNRKVDERAFKKVAGMVLKGEKAEKGNLSIAVACQARMRSLNKKYRKKDKPTDVLSFSYSEVRQNEIGEVVVCPDIVKKNAKKLDLDYNGELARVLIHGILHILGYDHEKSRKEAEIMEKKTEYYLSRVNLK